MGMSRVLAPFVAQVIIANPLQVKAIAQAQRPAPQSWSSARHPAWRSAIFFHRPTHHLAKMIADPRFIDLDHLTHRLLVTLAPI